MFGFLALSVERYKYAVLLSLLYFPFFSSLRNVLSTTLYLGFANLVHGYHCPRSIITNLLFPRRKIIASQIHRCRHVIVAPLGLPKNRHPFIIPTPRPSGFLVSWQYLGKGTNRWYCPVQFSFSFFRLYTTSCLPSCT